MHYFVNLNAENNASKSRQASCRRFRGGFTRHNALISAASSQTVRKFNGKIAHFVSLAASIALRLFAIKDASLHL